MNCIQFQSFQFLTATIFGHIQDKICFTLSYLCSYIIVTNLSENTE